MNCCGCIKVASRVKTMDFKISILFYRANSRFYRLNCWNNLNELETVLFYGYFYLKFKIYPFLIRPLIIDTYKVNMARPHNLKPSINCQEIQYEKDKKYFI